MIDSIKGKKLSKKIKIGVVGEIKIGDVGDRIPAEALFNEDVKVVCINEAVPSYIASLDSLVSFEDASLVDLDNRPPLNSKKNFKRNRMF